jgi:hypothetical protein
MLDETVLCVVGSACVSWRRSCPSRSGCFVAEAFVHYADVRIVDVVGIAWCTNVTKRHRHHFSFPDEYPHLHLKKPVASAVPHSPMVCLPGLALRAECGPFLARCQPAGGWHQRQVRGRSTWSGKSAIAVPLYLKAGHGILSVEVISFGKVIFYLRTGCATACAVASLCWFI